MKLFADHGLTQRIAISVSRQQRPGRMPLVHRLTPMGADFVEDETGQRPPRVARSDPPKPHTLLHRAGMGECILRFNAACRNQGFSEPEWVLEYDAVPGTPPSAPLSQRFFLRWDVPLKDGQTAACWPDALCKFTLPKNDRLWKMVIAWEYDRSTDKHSQLAGKMPGYDGWLKHRLDRQLFPDADAARIFFVVPSKDRRNNTIATLKDGPAASHVRLTTLDEFQPESLLTEPIWWTPSGECRSIITR